VSGLIYAVIVVMWAAFLVPMWLRRHDEFAEAKSVDKFASKMRVLARRTGEAEPTPTPATRPAAPAPVSTPVRAATSVPSRTVSSTVRIVGRDRPAIERPTPAVPTAPTSAARPVRPSGGSGRRSIREAWADEADDAALAALAAPVLARDLARDRGFGHAPATLAARRRRVLTALVGATVLLVILAAASVAPWLLAAPPAIATIGYVMHLRVQARRMREIAKLRTRAARFRAEAAQPSAAKSGRTAQKMAPATLVHDQLDTDDGWQPVSVPVPTYVTAPRAGRPIRRIDLQGDDAWTSGRLVADAAAAGRAAAAAAHQELLVAREAESTQIQRAVGD
jgi:hypothetical protein